MQKVFGEFEEIQSPAEAISILTETLERWVYRFISEPEIVRHLRLLLKTVTELRIQLEKEVQGSDAMMILQGTLEFVFKVLSDTGIERDVQPVLCKLQETVSELRHQVESNSTVAKC